MTWWIPEVHMPYLIYNYHFWMSSTRCFLLIALLNCPLNKFWGLWSIHNIYGVLPLGAGTSSGGPEGRSCEWYINDFLEILDKSRRCISSWYTCVSCQLYDNHQSTEEYLNNLTLKWTTHRKIGNTISEQQKLSQKMVGPFDPNSRILFW